MIPLAVEPIATYYKQCARYEWEVDENPETEAELLKLKASQAWADMIARVANRTGVEMDAKKVDLVYDQCRFELAFYPELYNNNLPSLVLRLYPGGSRAVRLCLRSEELLQRWGRG